MRNYGVKCDKCKESINSSMDHWRLVITCAGDISTKHYIKDLCINCKREIEGLIPVNLTQKASIKCG